MIALKFKKRQKTEQLDISLALLSPKKRFRLLALTNSHSESKDERLWSYGDHRPLPKREQ